MLGNSREQWGKFPSKTGISPFVLSIVILFGVVLSSGQLYASQHHDQTRSIEKIEYSEWNHQNAGKIVIALGLLALVTEILKKRKVRIRPGMNVLWPLGWIVLGLFLFIRSDPDNWPLGAIPFWDTVLDPETGQHKVFSLFMVMIGASEGMRESQGQDQSWASMVFPGLVLLSAVILGFHAQIHVATPAVYWNHMALSGLGFVVAGVKYFRNRGVLTGWPSAILWPIFIIMAGFLLLHYDEH